jgi:hypothetical protein
MSPCPVLHALCSVLMFQACACILCPGSALCAPCSVPRCSHALNSCALCLPCLRPLRDAPAPDAPVPAPAWLSLPRPVPAPGHSQKRPTSVPLRAWVPVPRLGACACASACAPSLRPSCARAPCLCPKCPGARARRLPKGVK